MNPYTARKIAKIIAIVLVTAMVVTSFSFVFFLASGNGVVYGATTNDDEVDWDKELDFIKELMLDLKVNFKDEITYEALLNGAYQGIFEALKDPYSVYYQSDIESDRFVESVNGEFSGIGVSLENIDSKCRVVAPISGTPADKAGILPGDIITHVDGQDVTGMSLEAIVARIKGKVGTKVTVTVDRAGNIFNFSLVREIIKTASVNYRMMEDKIGYIQITQFDNDSHSEFKNAKLQLIAQGAKSFIVDVRNNPGGYTTVAANIAEQLMPKGPITHFEQQGSIVETISASGEGDLGMPVVLLVNSGTASSSEILAGAWQDSDTAILVGTTTFGKGVAQQLAELDNGATIKVSMYYFLTPDKKSIDKVGITPDYLIGNYSGLNTDALSKQYKTFAPMSEKKKPKAGDTGLNVYGAQQRLMLLGYGVSITGNMDEKTVVAVKAMQKDQGLYAYGVLDYATMAALERATINYITGADSNNDLQLEKAIEILIN